MNKGFTLIELLVVVLIVGILSAVALPQYTAAVERSRASEGLTLLSAVAQAEERYRAQKDKWTTDFSKLDFEVPKNDTKYGGKLFELKFASGASETATSITILAERSISDKYTLSTVVTETTNGAFTVKRYCDPGSNSKATIYCQAITGGKSGTGSGQDF